MFIVLLGLWFNNRVPLEANIIRDRNALYRVNYEGIVENTYTLKILNKSQKPLHFDIDVLNIAYPEIKLPKAVLIEAGTMQEVPVTLGINGDFLKNKITEIIFAIKSTEQPEIQLQKNTVFFKD